jgi:hypothetical protein
MDQPDPRATELIKLKLALATFAVQLDAFEACLISRSFKMAVKSFLPLTPDIGFASQIVFAMKSYQPTDRPDR